MKHKAGLLIGRFQPFHKGHLYLVQEALKHVNKLVIGIGSSNIENEENPFDFEERKRMLKKVIEKENFKNIIDIFPIPDDPSDDVWLENTLNIAGKPDLYIGNDKWTTGIFKNAGYKILKIPYFKRELYEGKKIRPLIVQNEKWEDRVPSYLIDSIK